MDSMISQSEIKSNMTNDGIIKQQDDTNNLVAVEPLSDKNKNNDLVEEKSDGLPNIDHLNKNSNSESTSTDTIKTNEINKSLEKTNCTVEEGMEVEQCVVEPDLPALAGDNENNTETEDDPMDYCDKGDNADTTKIPSTSNNVNEDGLNHFLPVATPSLLKEKLSRALKPKKAQSNTHRQSNIITPTASDESDTESFSSIDEQNFDVVKKDILESLKKQMLMILSKEEEEIKNSVYYPGPQIQFSRLHCTACNKHMGSSLIKQKDRFVHPLLKTLVCESCFNFYTSGDFEKDEDGSELYCRWCGQGGKVICCSKCEYVFCSMCIKRNFGIKRLQEIKNSDDWLCFLCAPDQLLKCRVQCTALINYLMDELTRLSTLDNIDMYKTDYSTCCSKRKRKISWNKDAPFDIKEELSQMKKSKQSKHRSSSANLKKPILNTQEGEEEVVCAPDLLSFMDGEDDTTEIVNPNYKIEKPPTATRTTPPPLLSTSSTPLPILNSYRLVAPVVLQKNAMFIQNPSRNSVIIQPSAIKPKQLVQNPASIVKVKGNQMILNATMKNPITTQNIGNLTSSVEKVSTHKITLKAPKHNVPKLAPGLKYEWFDVASEKSTDILTKLSTNIATLSSDKNKATTMGDLATLHNKFQEALSKTINSMIQIRKNLRNEFLSSLNRLKFVKTVDNNKVEEDDDVVFVNSTIAPPKQQPQTSLPPPTESVSLIGKPGPYLKVRSVSQLLNVPSECITIPDEVIEKITENRKEEDVKKQDQQKSNDTVEKICDTSNDSNKENVFQASSAISVADDEKGNNTEENGTNTISNNGKENNSEHKDMNQVIEMTPEIRKAIFESQIEKLVNDNMKYQVSGISMKDLKRMLSVRVYLSENYKPKRKPVTVSEHSCDDFEALLDSSVVLKN